MKKTTLLLIGIIFIFILRITTSCMVMGGSVSTIESSNYDEKENQTTFIKFPFGSMSIPGKWTKVSYNQISFQHNFKNEDSVFTALAINQASSYPFYKPNMTSNELIKEFYEWDSKYLADLIKGNRTIIIQDTINHFILWQITADNEYQLDNHYLFGCENGIIFTILISTKKWTNEQKLNYLQTVYKNKSIGSCCQ